ncbi:hypothetical protein GF359_02010 [candidate division WOR-3 bacterium]|uniref:Phosphoribosyltransferase domain-containing protein n=1 Tax=candidate division WOR-3 bacterium TaxID=2052148 RepID=A0A9D5K8D5_UNCW3|nr:hypothetical protein [candidate division WOR-3 bacterium]MBD3363969.1 hypothetical protein [candidate division WOR-3 bacterium]
MTKTQTRLDDDARRRNVSGAFSMRKESERFVTDRTFVLIDDVCTTGSTLVSASRTLLDAGAERVYGLTVGGAWTD